MTDIRNGVVPLNGSNFPSWKIQCRMALLKQGVWRIVEGTEVPPDEYDEVNFRKYNDRKDRALSTIVLAVETSLLYLLGDPQDPQEVWNKLCDQFQRKTWANKLNLRRRLYSLRLKDDEPVQNHVKQMVEIFDELAIIGEPIEEEDRVVHVLSSLPDSFNMLVTALEASPEVPSLELVTERLLHEERKRKDKLVEQNNSSVGSSHDALFTSNSQKPRFNGPVCFYCGERGHIKRNCEEWKKRVEERENGGQSDSKKQPEIANFSYVQKSDTRSSDSEDYECIALVSKVAVRNKSRWIVDSAASNHMCCDRRLFSNLTEVDDTKKIKVGDGKCVTSSKEGTVMITVRTGKVVRKFRLTNVLYVPDLKFNLLSVAKAAEAGKRTEFNRQGCKFIDNKSNITVGSATKIGSLYYLDCVNSEDRKGNNRRIGGKEMKTALISVKANNFQEEMSKRLKYLQEDTNNSISIKEETTQNQEEKNSRPSSKNLKIEDKVIAVQKEESSESEVEELKFEDKVIGVQKEESSECEVEELKFEDSEHRMIESDVKELYETKEKGKEIDEESDEEKTAKNEDCKEKKQKGLITKLKRFKKICRYRWQNSWSLKSSTS